MILRQGMKIMTNGLFRLSLFSLTILILCAAAQAEPKIVFEKGDAIWIANLDGSGSRKLADGSLPEISPDGTRVAFNTDEGGEKTPVRHIAIVDIASGKVTQFKEVPSDNSFGPVWSPDGKKLIFSILTEGDWQLALINADGSGYRIVKRAQAKDRSYYSPAWASDGKSFFCHDLDFIYLVDLDGKLIKKWELKTILTKGDMNSNSRIAASSDGKWLIMDADMDEENNRENWDGPPPAIWLLDLASGKATRLTDKDFFAWDPFWITADEFIFASQGAKEESPSLYRGSTKGKPYHLVLKGAQMPSASH